MIKTTLLTLSLISPVSIIYGMGPKEIKATHFSLAAACEEGNVKKVAGLLPLVKDINVKLLSPFALDLPSESTFLHLGARHFEVVQLLIENGATVNVANKVGRTPLHYAASSYNTKAVELLLHKGARISFIGSATASPLICLLTVLTIENELRQNRNLARQLIANICEIIHRLKANGDDGWIRNGMGNSSMHCAAIINNADIALSLLMPDFSEQLKIDAQERFFTFMCINNRHKNNDSVIPTIPKDVVWNHIFPHMPIEAKHSRLKKLNSYLTSYNNEFLSLSKKDKIFLIRRSLLSSYEKATELEKASLMPDPFCESTVTNNSRLLLIKRLTTSNNQNKMPVDLATDTEVQKLLSADTWQLSPADRWFEVLQ